MSKHPIIAGLGPRWPQIAVGLLSLVPVLTWGGQIMEHKGVQIGLPDGQRCAPVMDVELQAESLDTFHRSRLDMQEVARLSRAYVSLDCPELEALRFEGTVDDKVVYQAQSAKASNWSLEEASETESQSAAAPASPAKPASAEPVAAATEPTAATPDDMEASNAASYASTEALQQQAASGDAAAQLDLARAQLGLADAPAGVEVPADVNAGVEQLEALARAGNADAMQSLAEAYLQHPDVPVNEALIAELTKVTPTAGDRLRGMAAALLTLKAAEQGSPGAISAMNEAGQAGSPSSYYALGTMYMLDRRGRMPRSKSFLRKRLKIRRKLSGRGRGNVDVGLHFMRLAASAGHAAAAAMLNDLGESFDRGSASGSASAASSSAGAEPANAGQAQATSSAAANLQAMGQGALSASVFSQVLEPASASGSVAGASGAAAGTGTPGSGSGSASRSRGAAGSGAPGTSSPGGSTADVAASGNSANSRRSTVRTRRPQSEGTLESETGEAEIID